VHTIRVGQDYIFKIKCMTNFGGSAPHIEKKRCDEVSFRFSFDPSFQLINNDSLGKDLQ